MDVTKASWPDDVHRLGEPASRGCAASHHNLGFIPASGSVGCASWCSSRAHRRRGGGNRASRGRTPTRSAARPGVRRVRSYSPGPLDSPPPQGARMTNALFDTEVFIDWWRGDTGAVSLVDAVKSGHLTASYSSITIAELWQWEQLGRQEEIEYVALTRRYLQEAPLGFEAARLAGRWLRDYGRNQRRELFADALIAATAQLRGETVYSRNEGHLRRFYADIQPY